MAQRPTIQVFDTTLRDGTQGEHISFSADDKVRIARELDGFGIHYIEGGWPGSNPKDMEFFEKAKEYTWENSKVVAFGSTCRSGNTPEEDANIQALLKAETPAISIFGKSWMLHVEDSLGITADENVAIISDSIEYLKKHDKEVIYDAEHFFDGYKDDPDYAIRTLKAAEDAGADVLVLCDTNGGTLPGEVDRIVREVKEKVSTRLGIHAHNDSEVAVANSMTAIAAGCRHVQGTINGYGERCGNANLCSIIPNLQLKEGMSCVPEENIDKLTNLSRLVSELANLRPNDKLPYVGRSAFAHKGGVHVSAVMKNASTYEHMKPESVGNERRVLVSDLSGKSNLRFKSKELGLDLNRHKENLPEIVQKLKELENQGYQFEGAEASFRLLVNRMTGDPEYKFHLEGFRVIVDDQNSHGPHTEATIRLNINGQIQHSAATGNGPVHALDRALRKALHEYYPQISRMHLADYKVRVLNGTDGTDAKVRVLIKSGADSKTWGTIGVSENIIQASWCALSDSFHHFLLNHATEESEVKHHAK